MRCSLSPGIFWPFLAEYKLPAGFADEIDLVSYSSTNHLDQRLKQTWSKVESCRKLNSVKSWEESWLVDFNGILGYFIPRG